MIEEKSEPAIVTSQLIRQPRFHVSDVRVSLAYTLLLAVATVIAVKVYFAERMGFRDMCTLDQLFDPIIAFTGGSITAIIGFYFGERGR